ncbi:MAG: hypothetical protein IKF38_06970 [Clostridia bacterium]|nr:hypothetical protein [Clostridia bacterium]
MAKIKEKIALEKLLLDKIDNSSTNDWDELCNACSSLVKEANMSNEDIDAIVDKVKKGAI